VTDIAQIVAQCKRGNRQAQKQLYEAFAPKLFAVCLRYCKNRMEAEDMLHEGFIKIFEKIGQYRGEGNISAWLRKVMVNIVLDEMRKSKEISFVDEKESVLERYAEIDDNEDEQNDDIYDVDINEVFELVNQMPEKYKLVFNLYIIEKYSHDKIASELGISKGTSKSNLSRARNWLKKQLENKKIKK